MELAPGGMEFSDCNSDIRPVLMLIHCSGKFDLIVVIGFVFRTNWQSKWICFCRPAWLKD